MGSVRALGVRWCFPRCRPADKPFRRAERAVAHHSRPTLLWSPGDKGQEPRSGRTRTVNYAIDPRAHLSPTPATLIGDVDGVGDRSRNLSMASVTAGWRPTVSRISAPAAWKTADCECGLSGAPAGPRGGAALGRGRAVRAVALERGPNAWPLPAAGACGKTGGTAAGMGGGYPPCSHVLVPEGLPPGMHLAGVDHDPRGSRAVLRPERGETPPCHGGRLARADAGLPPIRLPAADRPLPPPRSRRLLGH
jgi:hypothetical protein